MKIVQRNPSLFLLYLVHKFQADQWLGNQLVTGPESAAIYAGNKIK